MFAGSLPPADAGRIRRYRGAHTLEYYQGQTTTIVVRIGVLYTLPHRTACYNRRGCAAPGVHGLVRTRVMILSPAQTPAKVGSDPRKSADRGRRLYALPVLEVDCSTSGSR